MEPTKPEIPKSAAYLRALANAQPVPVTNPVPIPETGAGKPAPQISSEVKGSNINWKHVLIGGFAGAVIVFIYYNYIKPKVVYMPSNNPTNGTAVPGIKNDLIMQNANGHTQAKTEDNPPTSQKQA